MQRLHSFVGLGSRILIIALIAPLLLLSAQPNSHAAPALATANMILNVDGTNSSSYNGSGTTWTDLSSAGNDLTLGGGNCLAAAPSWSSTEGGGSFLFNTDKHCIRRNTMSSAPQNFSFFFWIKPTALPASGTYAYLAQIGRDAGQSNQEYMFGFNSNGQLYFWDYYNGYGYSSVTSDNALTKVTTNTWQYVGFVKNGTSATFYIGKAGTMYSVGNVTGTNVSYTNTSFVSGYDYRDNNNFFKGYLGAIHYYGAVLSSSTITDNYNATPRLSRQTISISSLGTSSKSYPYSQALNITTSGTSGTGAKSYAVTNGTATGCTLSDTNLATATLSASTEGTCFVTATIAADSTYAESTSTAQTFTFSKASQSAITITTTSTRYGSDLSLLISGGSTGGTPTYSVNSGSCTITGTTLRPTGVGSCIVVATLATDYRYLAQSSSATTINIANGLSTATVTFNPGTMYYREARSITATTSSAGKVSFKANNVFLPGCRNLNASSLNSYQVSCQYRPSLHGYVTLTVIFDPSDTLILGTAVSTNRYWVERRTTKR